MAPFRISRDRNPLDDTSLCIVVLVLLVLVARREVPFGRLRTHLRPLELKTSHNTRQRRRRKKEKEKTLLRFFCVMSKCMYLHIRHAHDDFGEYYSSKSDERTRQQKRPRRLRGGPFFSFLPLRQRERESILFARIFLCQKKHKIIGRTHHKNPIIHSYFRTHLFCASSFRKHKNNARTPPPIIIIIIIIREGGGVLKNETAGPNCHVTTTTTRVFSSRPSLITQKRKERRM